MGEAGTDLALRVSVSVDATAAVAFQIFTERLDTWWVREFTWSGPECLDRIGIEPHLDGKAYELGPHGFRLDWGRVLHWEPPVRFVLAWQIAPDRVPQPDPARASELDVRFREAHAGTLVEVEHRHFRRHGPDGEGYRRVMTDGWHELLDRYAAAVALA